MVSLLIANIVIISIIIAVFIKRKLKTITVCAERLNALANGDLESLKTAINNIKTEMEQISSVVQINSVAAQEGAAASVNSAPVLPKDHPQVVELLSERGLLLKKLLWIRSKINKNRGHHHFCCNDGASIS